MISKGKNDEKDNELKTDYKIPKGQENAEQKGH